MPIGRWRTHISLSSSSPREAVGDRARWSSEGSDMRCLAPPPELGPLIVVGADGVLVELLADPAVALPPVSAKPAADMAAGLRVNKAAGRDQGRG